MSFDFEHALASATQLVIRATPLARLRSRAHPALAGALLAVTAAGLLAPGAANAGAGEIRVVVTPLTTAVSYSVAASTVPVRPALNTTIGYVVSISNAGGNTINNVRFTGAAVATDAQETATLSSIDGRICTVTGPSSIDCAIGQLRAGQSAESFAVFFNAPVKDSVSPLPDGNSSACTTTDCVLFSGITYYAEGTGGLANSTPINSTVAWSAGPVTLGTFSTSLVKSALEKKGGTLFTGDGGVTTGTDRFTTSVVVPAIASYTSVLLQETPFSTNCTNNFSVCFSSEITIPGVTFSPYLTITLRQDASTILKGTKIQSVLIQYTGPGGTVIIGDCASPTTPRSDGVPCIAKRVVYRNSRTPGWTLELDGDFEWTIINTKNGSYAVF